MLTEGDAVKVLEDGPYKDFTGKVTRIHSNNFAEVTFPSIFPDTKFIPKDLLEKTDKKLHIERW